MTKIQNPQVAELFDSFPEGIRRRLMEIRNLIFSTGNSLDEIGTVQETIKWGEPSYTTISGSAIRLGWKKADPEKYAVYFHCQTSLVSTFRKLYGKTFQFEGNRAIVFQKGEEVPLKELEHCVAIALTYHRRKRLPMLGAETETYGQK